MLEHLRQHDLDQIFLVAPTTTDERQELICQQAAGFVYYVALKGVTGSADLDSESVAKDIANLKSKTQLPVAVGFGVKDADSAVAVAAEADAVVIGSALVAVLGQCEDLTAAKQAVTEFIKPIRTALNSL